MASKLTELHPDISKQFLETYVNHKKKSKKNDHVTLRILKYLDRLVDITPPKKIVVLGCGPMPDTIRTLKLEGHEALGVEPVEEYVDYANNYLEGDGKVIIGRCEQIPSNDNEFDVLICKQVLEHVDSPEKSLDEFYRVLKPGGVVFISTENRNRFSVTGKNNEFDIRFYNWFPRGVKEGYINKHLNKNPELAAYTPFPAVHWYTYPELCRLGRYAGFGKFYSLVDVVNYDDPRLGGNLLKRFVYKIVKKNMWLRWLFLTQKGGSTIFMYKRKI